uniref:S10-locus linked F-box protein type-18 n=1 Tax=Petunia hybrida TaxID=4102 RepID=E2RZI9_PETHY|nr:S5-locus linked F-box protein [Petunia x hybrida]BAQ18968.1 S10-locus linked F-box protein type-18 [Petunia x hybrida]BAQ19018.1 S22-locus linked F-box protein type-18 [Petunia x hybrida]BAQ19053.1 Sm-locus linked F-box protein type-18 [Petunia x hybrida]BAQ19082.1 S22m-locus linked F-box protein type-18 [Petunia x hybrida]
MVEGLLKTLPNDLTIYILLILPVKALMRLKCVSKTCYTLIQSSAFVDLHLNRKTTSKDECILLKRSLEEGINRYKTSLSFLCGDDHDYLSPIIHDVDVTHLTTNCNFCHDQLVGPCHGLIALMHSPTTVLFNPSTRKYKLLPPSPLRHLKGFYRSMEGEGFGFDSIINNYKVVKISTIYKVDHFDYLEEIGRKVEVYDLSTDSWRELDHVAQELTTLCCVECTQMFYKGACHWIATQDLDAFRILCFDMSSEVFRSLKIPENCHLFEGPWCRLALIQESLTLIYYRYPDQSTAQGKDSSVVWIMKDYSVHESWVKNYTITSVPIHSPLAVWKGYLLVFEGKSGCLMSYDLICNKIKELNFHGFPESLRALVYKDSLISIPIGSEHSAQVHRF